MKIQDITEGYGRYYCSTDKKWKTRKGPKQTRNVSEAETPENEIERLKLRQNAEHGGASLKRQAETQARIRELEKKIKDKKQGVAEAEIDRPGMKDGRPYSDPYRRHPGNSSYMTPEYMIQKYKERLEQIAAGPYKRPKEVAQLQSRIAKLEKQGVAEGTQTVGHEILGMLRQVKRQGHDAMEELYSSCPLLAQYWDQYEGDFRSMVIELSPKTLNRIKAEISAFNQQDVEEEKQRLDPKCWDGYKKQGTKMKGGVRVNNCVKEDSLEEYGDTAQGQKMLTKVQKRAVDRVVSKKADTDPKYAKKNSDTAKRAWDRMTDLEETYDGDEFFEAYGELWYNEDEQLDEAEYQGRNVPLGKPMQGDVKKFKVYVKDPSTGNVKKVNFGDPDMKIRKSNPAARRSFRARHNCDNPGPRTKARYWSCRKW